jgi:phosphoserine phosphatase
MVYQPMLEVMKYLRDNGYRTYIVTGGGQDFVRAYARQVYGNRRNRSSVRRSIPNTNTTAMARAS